MPHYDPQNEIKLYIDINLQYKLAWIPVFGVFISFITSLINIRKIKRSATFSWWIQSFLIILMFCVICCMLIYACSLLKTYVFTILAVIAAYITFAGMAIAMICVEKKVAIRLMTETTSEMSNDEEEVK